MRALIVDDSRALRRILAGMLAELGFETCEAANGCDAVTQLLAGLQPDLMLVDWNMPEMSGLQMVQAVRRDPKYQATPIMMVTSETELEPMRQALEAGANEYVMKPFGKDMIVEKLQLLGF
jgi:two-component system chemotaxis response regulator CheY